MTESVLLIKDIGFCLTPWDHSLATVVNHSVERSRNKKGETMASPSTKGTILETGPMTSVEPWTGIEDESGGWVGIEGGGRGQGYILQSTNSEPG